MSCGSLRDPQPPSHPTEPIGMTLPLSGAENVSGRFHRHGVERGAGGGVQRFVVFAAEIAVGRLLGEFNDAEQIALRAEDLNAEGGRDVEVALGVDREAVAAGA